jgi:hypothetical protein
MRVAFAPPGTRPDVFISEVFFGLEVFSAFFIPDSYLNQPCCLICTLQV